MGKHARHKRVLRVTTFLVSVPLFAAAGCSGNGSTAAGPAAGFTPPPPPSAPASTTPPAETPTRSPTQAPREDTATTPAPTGDANHDGLPDDGSCGLVTSASGLRLAVLPDHSVSCIDALELVRHFHRMLGGRQPAGYDKPVSASVDGWMCVSGPPAAQGGTTCSQGEKTVFASVVTE